MASGAKKISSIVGGGLFGVLLLLWVVPPTHGMILGFIEVHLWELKHGKDQLTCGGSQRMTIRGQKIVVKSGDLTGPFADMGLIDVGGDCQLEIIDSDIEAPKVLSAGGSAHVLIQGGHITGTEEAISSGGDAVVEVKGAKVDGKVSGRPANLVGISTTKEGDTPRASGPKGWDELACQGVAACFSEAGFAGNVSVTVTSKVSASGKVTGAELEGDAPADVQKCIVKGARAKTLSDYDGKPGKLVCKLVGTINGGTQMLSVDSTFSH